MSHSFPEPLPVDGGRLRFALVAARYNQDLVDDLLQSARATLRKAGVADSAVEVIRVPGSNEVPFAVQLEAESGRFDACIALGVLLKGATAHHHIVAQSVSDALQMVALNTGIPIINGVVVAESRAQAEERVRGGLDRGVEFGQAALEMAVLKKSREEKSGE